MVKKRRRRYSPQHRQERVSRKQFEDFLEPYEWITGEIDPDLGEDILVRIYDRGVSTGLSLYVQLKSVQNIDRHKLKNGNLSFGFEVADLEHWENQDPPVFMVVWDVNKKTANWIWIDDTIRFLDKSNPGWRENKIVKVHIPVENILDELGLRRIRHILADRLFPVISRDKVISVLAEFQFTPTPEGKAKQAEFERHLAAGDQVRLDGQYINKFELPEWWTRVYGEMDPKSMFVWLGPTKSLTPQTAQFDFNLPENGSERIPYIELLSIKQGQEEITLSNEHQNIPFIFRLASNIRTKQIALNFTSHLGNIDAYTARQALRILNIIAGGGDVRIAFLETGDVITLPGEPGIVPSVRKDILEFVENLAVIQQKTGKIIKFPADGSFTFKDAKAVEELISVINTGTYRERKGDFSIEMRKPAIEIIAEGCKEGEPIRFQFITEESYVELMFEQITLGLMTQFITGQWEMSIDEVRTWLENASDEDYLKVHLLDIEMYEEFNHWLKPKTIYEHTE